MALALYATPSNLSGTGTSFSQAVDVGSGSDRLLLVGCAYYYNGAEPTITAITYNGVALTLVTGSRSMRISSARYHVVEWYSLAAPASGSNTLAITFDQSVECEIVPVALTGGHQTTPTGDVDIVTAVDPCTHSMTTVQDNSFVLQIATGRTVIGPFTPTSPAIEWVDIDNASQMDLYAGYRTTTTAGAYTIEADQTGTNTAESCSSAVEVREATGGGGGSPPVAVTTSSGGPIPLALQLYEERGGALIADISDATDCVIDNGRHGFRSLSCFVPMPLELAFAIAEQSKAKWLSLNYGAGVAWEGRVEDPTVVIAEDDGTGLALTAFGAWRSLFDVPYTALWSKSGTADWRIMTNDNYAFMFPSRYQQDNNNRLYFAPLKNSFISTQAQAGYTYAIPHGSGREIVGVSFDYELVATVGTWTLRVETWSESFSGAISVFSTSSAGSVSGSINLSFSADERLVFRVWAPAFTYTGESGATYIKVTNVRLVTSTTNKVDTTTAATISAGSQAVTPASMTGIYVGQRLFIDSNSAPSESVTVTAVTATTFTATFANAYSGTTTIEAHVVYADEIISDLVSHVTSINPAQLSASTALIESPGLDLLDESYEDAWPGDIATKLAALGDNQSPPRLWEVGVWEGQKLHFRPKGSDGQVWAVDADELTVNSTLELLRNSMVASYQDANNRTLRTAVADDTASQAQYGITRRGVVSASTTSATQAETHRDAALEDGRTIRPRSELQPDYLMDQTGAIAPKWLARAGQTMNIRNLPPTLGSEVDRIRTFLLEENSYDVMEDVLTPVPEEPVASLEVLVARRGEGF